MLITTSKSCYKTLKKQHLPIYRELTSYINKIMIKVWKLLKACQITFPKVEVAQQRTANFLGPQTPKTMFSLLIIHHI